MVLLIVRSRNRNIYHPTRCFMDESIDKSSPDRGFGRGGYLTERGAACGIVNCCSSVGQYLRSRAASTDGDEGTIMSIFLLFSLRLRCQYGLRQNTLLKYSSHVLLQLVYLKSFKVIFISANFLPYGKR